MTQPAIKSESVWIQAATPKKIRNLKETIIEVILFLAAFSSVATTIGIMEVLILESVHFFEKVPLIQFLTDTVWSPLFADPRYGIIPLLSGTLTTSIVAMFVAVPLGTIAAIYLSEFAPPRLREVVKPCLELLAAIPTVVYGYFAFLNVTPFLQTFLPDLPSFNMLSAGLVMGLMIIPLISSISEDAMRAVPLTLREGSYATGATRLQTALNVVLPAAISGISAAYILGVSRAVGETMIVAIAAGLQPNLSFNPFSEAATITAYIVQVSLGDLPHGSIEYQSIFAAGIMLVILTLIFNIIGYFLAKKYREVY
ncbi:phosphate ABC transporter permease subunit PstC [Microcystis aeruginosa NIES-298]|uniref:Phosphate transport system permease protein n=1 Tax=Microcystis aeruginosa NIES-298 TaxID=449468 RepID=A0A2H6BLB4_MICAE|nr:phosphate ABC transporter permease subunit PstC [Microcystis aeruginosa]QHU85687.1 phosphate ABC transporter permease subunit PstC [Microcystis aeruginosa NIES-298]GBD50964.1 phosphate ABC transporter, inner membrane subunit PstC [Microcystis aeruginosa NIES-298]GBE96649.1 phosphate ABC transporter permease subunit PstC [Microcystis aeruginosa NIES-298]